MSEVALQKTTESERQSRTGLILKSNMDIFVHLGITNISFKNPLIYSNEIFCNFFLVE